MTVTDAPSVLAGRYLLGREIGHGGMAVVYRGWDTLLQREVAVKVLRRVVADPAGRARFRAEGDVLARLYHPGLVTLYDTGDLDGSPYLVMELIGGESLSTLLGHGPLQPGRAVAVGIALAKVLTYVHDHGITHRDVKPGNILLDPQDRVRLADFGVARVPGSAEHTQPGFTMGTAAYIAPEQVRGEPATPASDIYSLGLVLLEALTGRRVYPGPADAAALARLTTPPSVAPAPEPMRQLLAAMTSDSPDDRPPAAAVRARLEALLAAIAPAGGSEQPPVPWTTLITQPARPARPPEAWVPALVPEPRGESHPAPRGLLGATLAAALMLPVLTLVTCLLVAGGGSPPTAVPAAVPTQDTVHVVGGHGPPAVARIGAAVAARR